MEKENANNYIELRLSDLWKVLKRCWWMLLAVLIAVTGAFYLFMDRNHVDQYKATATLYVLRTNSKTQVNYQDAAFATAIIDDCVKMICSEENVIIPAVRTLAGSDTEYTAAELSERVALVINRLTVKSVSTDSRLINITVTSGTAEGAAKVANAVAYAATEYLNELFGQSMVTVTDVAKVPNKISNPVSLTKAGLFGVVAAALVYLIWLVIFILDDRIDSEAHVERYLGLTVLGAIPYREQGQRRRKNRYGSYYGYYGYGYGALQQGSQERASSDADKEAK